MAKGSHNLLKRAMWSATNFVPAIACFLGYLATLRLCGISMRIWWPIVPVTGVFGSLLWLSTVRRPSQAAKRAEPLVLGFLEQNEGKAFTVLALADALQIRPSVISGVLERHFESISSGPIFPWEGSYQLMSDEDGSDGLYTGVTGRAVRIHRCEIDPAE